MSENLRAQSRAPVLLEGPGSRVVSRRHAVEIADAVQCESRDLRTVECGERQGGIETAPCQHGPQLFRGQLHLVVGERPAESPEQRVEVCLFQ